jgi:hypothetical protein
MVTVLADDHHLVGIAAALHVDRDRLAAAA